MVSSELSILIGELLDVPTVTVSGQMRSWHDQAITGILSAFRDAGNLSMVLDIAGMSFEGSEGVTSLINALRQVGSGMCIHVAAAESFGSILRRAELGPSVKLYMTTEEIAQYLVPVEDYLTSRWMGASSSDGQQSLAA